MTSMIVTPRHNDLDSSALDKRLLRLHFVIDSLPLLQCFCFSYPTDIGHFRITYVGGNHVVDVSEMSDHYLLGESCIFKHRIPGECSLVASTIHFLTPKFDRIMAYDGG